MSVDLVEAGPLGLNGKPMTTEEFLALPDDGVERWLIKGRVREWNMPTRNRRHSRIMARICQLLGNWLDARPEPRGELYSGDAACRLADDPETIVGIDVAYTDADLAKKDPEETTIIDGIPTLAIEILSPSDTMEKIDEKVALYGAVELPLVWFIHPRHRTVTVYQPGEEPVLFNVKQELSGEPHLPGLKLRVESIFTR
jgi:Uma2 family endonuclease